MRLSENQPQSLTRRQAMTTCGWSNPAAISSGLYARFWKFTTI